MLRLLRVVLQALEFPVDVGRQDRGQLRDALAQRRELVEGLPGLLRGGVFGGERIDDTPGSRADRGRHRRRTGLFGQRCHLAQARAHGPEVLLHQLQRVLAAEHLVLARDAFQRADVFRKQAVVLGRRDAREDERLALFRQPVEVEQRPDHRHEQRQGNEAEADEDQSIQ